VSQFEAQIRILDLKSILTAGFNCVLHVHAAIEEVTFAKLLHKLQKGTNRKSKLPPSHAKKGDSIIAVLQVTGGAGSVCVERFEDYPQMGRFTLRDQVCLARCLWIRVLRMMLTRRVFRVKPSPLARSRSSLTLILQSEEGNLVASSSQFVVLGSVVNLIGYALMIISDGGPLFE
jgi:hypothetical protein